MGCFGQDEGAEVAVPGNQEANYTTASGCPLESGQNVSACPNFSDLRTYLPAILLAKGFELYVVFHSQKFLKGLAEYREGHFAKASEWLAD